MAKDKTAEKLIERHKKMLADRQVWLPQWQTIGKYVMIRKQNFTSNPSPGQFLTADVFDGTAPSAAHLCASTLLGALFPNAERSFQLKAPKNMPKDVAGSDEVKAYYEFCTEVISNVLSEPKINLYSILNEYMIDQVTFGISGIGVFENEDDPEFPVRFESVDAKMICIAEGKEGFVERIFIEQLMTVYQLVQEYGIESISEKSAKNYKDGNLEAKVKVLRVIEPRIENSDASFGDAQFPIASIHIEYDECKVLKPSGFYEMPIFVTRFEKAMDEVYGRSPAFNTMPNILEANAWAEMLIIAGEKILDPPLLVREDGTTEGGVIDTSARAVNVRHINGRIESNNKAVEQLVTIGDVSFAQKRLDTLKETIKDDFFIDRLVDLNNKTRMTAYETGIRNELRSQSLGAVYARQIVELFSPLIRRVFNILLNRGLLGVPEGSQEYLEAVDNGMEPPYVIPEAILNYMINGKTFYEIAFISPAARIMQYEELKGIQDMTQAAVNVASVSVDSLDVIDFDEALRRSQSLYGAPSAIIRSAEQVAKLREGRQQAQAAQMQQQQALVQAETAKKAAQAAQAGVKAGLPIESLGVM